MEALPRTEMLAPELKDPEHPFPMSECNKIKQYIMMHYQNDPNNFNSAFSELDDMRSKMLQRIDELELLCVLKRYYAQLTMMKNRFPMELDGDAAVQFTWTERSSDNALPIVIPDINFEICCVMFNIGCLHAIVAASQHRKDDDSCKAAFMHFQHAAWPFICLRDELNARRCGLVDFDDISLTFYANVMLAQAQEAILEKSITEKRPPKVIFKIAYRIFQLYNSCGTLINNPGFADMMSSSRYRSWTRLCSIKGAIYGVIYFHARGQELNEDQKYGAALACFKSGLDLANEMMPLANKDKRTSFKETLIYVRDVIAQREQVARKENDLIYHERIPALTELEEIKGADMVKAISFKMTDPSIAGEDLFKALLPSSVVEIVSLYEESKAELRRSVLNKCEKMDTELESFLMTLKLDKLNLDQPGDIQRLPDELLSCYSEFKSQPDCVHSLLEKFHELTTKTSNVECQLAELSNRISAITTPQFAASKGYKAISNELSKLAEQHKQARSNNTELQKRLDAHTDNLKLFALSLPELTNEVGGKVIDTSKSPEGQALRRLLDKVDEMRKQRIRLIGELRESLERDDITSHALADPHSDPKPIIKAQLTQHDKQIGIIDQNLAAQENILRALTEANANFADFRRQINDTIESKKTKAITLVTAFETFKQIRNNTDKAINFYDNMLKLLARISDGIRNMEQAKKLEDEEQRIIVEKEQAKLQSLEVAEFVKEFSIPNQIPQNYAPSHYIPSSIPTLNQPAISQRPKLGDFLRNRNKDPANSTQNVPQTSQPFSQHQQVNSQLPISQPSLPPSTYQIPISQPSLNPTSQSISQYNHPQINPTSQQMTYAPISQHQMNPASQNYAPINQPQMANQQMTYAPISQPQLNPTNYAPISRPPMANQNYAPISQPQMANQNYAPISQPQMANQNYSTSQPHSNPTIQNYSSVSQPQSNPVSQFNHYHPSQQYSSAHQSQQFNQPIMSTSQQNQTPQMHHQPISQHFASTSQPTQASPQNFTTTQVPYSQQQPISTQSYNLPQNPNVQQSNMAPNSSYQNQFVNNPMTPNSSYQNQFNGNNGNSTPQTAQSSLDDLLFGGQTANKPAQVSTNSQSNNYSNGAQGSNNGFQQQGSNGFSPATSNYQQQMKPCASPWHNSSINPLLMNRKN